MRNSGNSFVDKGRPRVFLKDHLVDKFGIGKKCTHYESRHTYFFADGNVNIHVVYLEFA